MVSRSPGDLFQSLNKIWRNPRHSELDDQLFIIDCLDFAVNNGTLNIPGRNLLIGLHWGYFTLGIFFDCDVRKLMTNLR